MTRSALKDTVAQCVSEATWIFSVAPRDVAEEVLQSAYIDCVTSFERKHPEQAFRCAYFRTAVRRRLKRSMTLRGRDEPLIGDVATERSDEADLDWSDAAARVLRKLTPFRRQVLVLEAAGYTRAEIAHMTGTTPGAVNGALFRGRNQLRAALAPDGAVLTRLQEEQ